MSGRRATQGPSLVLVMRFLQSAGMQVGLRHFDSRTLDWLTGTLRSGEHTRHALARDLCEHAGRLNALGRPCPAGGGEGAGSAH